MNLFFQNTNQRSFGTYPLTGRELRNAIETAVEVGYRAFDTAQMYGNEAEVGGALVATGIARNDLCVATKVHPDNFDTDRFMASVEQSLTDLQLDHVDALLLHWPPVGGEIAPSLELLQHAYERGLTRNIGVSNYTIQMMRDATAIVDAPIITNQVEFHPLLDQTKLLAGANEVGIPLSSYSSVARGEVFKYPEFGEIGEAYGKTAGQVVLRWILQMGVSVNTMSTNPENIRRNFDIMDFTLSSIDMARIGALAHNNLRIVTEDLVPWAPQWD